jgi:hypothetical protein
MRFLREPGDQVQKTRIHAAFFCERKQGITGFTS